MENNVNTQHRITPDNSSRLLGWIAAVAIILFGIVGIAAFMGWLPNSTAHPEERASLHTGKDAVLDKNAALDKKESLERKEAPDRQAADRQSSRASGTAPSSPVPKSSSSSFSSPSAKSSGATASAPVAQATTCPGCGEIASVREVVTKAKGSGLGAAGGAVVGGVLGNQVGEGRGKDVATAAGVIGGAVAGNEIEKRTRATKSYEITVRLDNGATQVINETNPPSWRAGDRVKVVNGVIHSTT